MTTSLRATPCAICQQDLEPAQRWRCQVCPDYEVCGPCYSNGIINHPHTLISPQSPTAQLRAVLLHVTTCCTTQCQYPRWGYLPYARQKLQGAPMHNTQMQFRARFSRSQQQADSRRRAAVVRQRDADAATASTPDSST
ncbi:hypothetical protein F2Q69_00031762 [Brassica cretica]|uniref:histone acetyltransferase n=1 Tax=Brassica cretica TaxID=69181 RepID=A0A8S9SBY8_BRACR|nr:hypothetical protein F2Q69_00031762 [Brassica cretica]